MISDDQIFSSFKNIRGTHQYFHNMLLDALAKIRQSGVYTFFLTCSPAEFHWTEKIQVVACQYGQTLTNEQVNNGLEYKGKKIQLLHQGKLVMYSSNYGVKLF